MFDFDRFARLAVAHWAEYRRQYAWFLGIGMILHAAIALMSFTNTEGFRMFDTDGQEVLHQVGLFLLTPIFAGRYFQAMADRRAALLNLMRPASTLEKWLLAVLVVVVLYPLAYTVAYYVVDIPAWLVSRERAADYLAALAARPDGPGANTMSFDMGSQVRPEKFALFVPLGHTKRGDVVSFVLWLVAVQGFAMLGSLTFRTVPFIKTLLAGFLFVLLALMAASAFGSRPDLFFSYWHTTRQLSAWQQVVYPAVWFLVPGLLWAACFLALREREIAA
jgi:hypothetical protein